MQQTGNAGILKVLPNRYLITTSTVVDGCGAVSSTGVITVAAAA